MRRILDSTLAVVALCACSTADEPLGPSPGGSTEQVGESSLARGKLSSHTRLLSGRCTTVVTRLEPPPIEVQRVEYTCRISHLGLTHAVVIQTVDVTTGALRNSGVWIAANGDQLNSDFSGVAVLTFTDPTDAIVTFRGIQRFSPGTGRFVEGNGAAQLVGETQIDLITGAGTGEFTLEGTLTY
jgi:hypothetical protein